MKAKGELIVFVINSTSTIFVHLTTYGSLSSSWTFLGGKSVGRWC